MAINTRSKKWGVFMKKIEEFKDGEYKFEVFEESDKWFLKMKGAGETTLIKDLMNEE